MDISLEFQKVDNQDNLLDDLSVDFPDLDDQLKYDIKDLNIDINGDVNLELGLELELPGNNDPNHKG